MTMRTLHPLRRHGERKLLDGGPGRSSRQQDEEKDADCLQQFSRCPACGQERDIVLILPCSHILCVHCVAAGERENPGDSRHRSAGPPVCSALCPGCRGPVELPCWDWSSATSCLPKHPTLCPACVSRETAPEDHLPRGNTCNWDAVDMTAQSCLHGSNLSIQAHSGSIQASISSVAPVGGTADLREEEMEQSVFGLRFALDPSTVPPSLRLSESSLTITYQGDSPPAPLPDNKVRRSMTCDPVVTLALPQVCANVVIARGQYYWEVDVCNSSVYRIGVRSLDGSGGWWLQRQGLYFCTVYDGSQEPLCTVPPQIKTLGVFLNIAGGALSFYNPLTQEHLGTLPTRFNPAGVLPALGLGQGRLRLRSGLPPPPHVFLSKESAYRRPRGPDGGRWRRQIPFQSVRKAIQKFEELAASDTDSGFASTSRSSCSTLASLPDLGISSGDGEQETVAE